MNVHGFFYVPGDPLQLPIYYSEAFCASWASCGVLVVVYGDGDLYIPPKSGVINSCKYQHIRYPEEYIGESSWSFGNRLKEHLMAPFPIHHHSHSTGHPVNPKCFTLVDRELQGITRNIKKPCTFVLMNHPSTETLENINFHTYGRKYYRTPHHYS